MSSPLDRALKDRLDGPIDKQRLTETAIRRAQHQKREIIVLEDTPIQNRSNARPPSSGGLAPPLSRRKPRMDVMPSDLYGHDRAFDSDDSIPDISAAFGLPARNKQTKPPQSNSTLDTRKDQTPSRRASQENRYPSIHSSPPHAGRLSFDRIQQLIQDFSSLPGDSPHRPPSRGNPKAPIIIDIDGLDSSSPLPPLIPLRNPINRAKSLNASHGSSSPAPRVPSVRTPLQRANTFPSENMQPTNDRIYHDISDDDDKDLKAAIAASLADFEASQSQPAPAVRPIKETPVEEVEIISFEDPDSFWQLSPRPSQSRREPSRSQTPSIPKPSISTPRPLDNCFRSSPPSSQASLVRDETRRMLDEITRNVLKRKSSPIDDIPPQPKKKSTTTKKTTAADPTENPKPKRRALTQEEKDARAASQSAKEAAREAKRLEKEAKALEKAQKQQIEALNRLKGRKDACPELLVYLPTSLSDSLHDKILNFLEPLGLDTREWTPSAADVIKFVRKVTAEWDEEGGYFRPCDEEYRRDEEWIVHWFHAEDFVQKACFDPTGRALKVHIERVKNVLPGKKVIVILEGLAGVVAKAVNARNRRHHASVRNHLRETSRANKEDSCVNLDTDELEMALIEMQLVHEIRIVQTVDEDDSAEWTSILATDIASIPYKRSLMFLDRSFCMEKGQFKAGASTEDTFHKMLQQIHGVTPPKADAITGMYKSIGALINGFRRDGTDILANIPTRMTAGGNASGRTLGTALSRKMHNIFMGENQFALA